MTNETVSSVHLQNQLLRIDRLSSVYESNSFTLNVQHCRMRSKWSWSDGRLLHRDVCICNRKGYSVDCIGLRWKRVCWHMIGRKGKYMHVVQLKVDCRLEPFYLYRKHSDGRIYESGESVIEYESRDSSVGRASDWRSEGLWFDPGSWHLFCQPSNFCIRTRHHILRPGQLDNWNSCFLTQVLPRNQTLQSISCRMWLIVLRSWVTSSWWSSIMYSCWLW